MHDIWNPWHGCHKYSEGCRYCSMDQKSGRSGADIYRTKIPTRSKKDRRGQYKIRRGEMLWVCMTSDFFLPEADPWRDDAWDMIRMRPDVIFFLLTKRPKKYPPVCRKTGATVGKTYFFTWLVRTKSEQRNGSSFCLLPPFVSKASSARLSGAHLPALPSPFAMDARTVKICRAM